MSFPLRPWYGCRERHLLKLTHAQAEDVIRNCVSPKDDPVFAAKYRLSVSSVSAIRRGKAWRWLRQEIKEADSAAAANRQA